jgi:hypothetical protein
LWLVAFNPHSEGMSDEALGPAMRACSERERRFVLAMLADPGMTQWRAAELAGAEARGTGQKRHDVLRRAGCDLAHRPRVLDAILEVSRAHMRGDGPLIVAREMLRIAADPTHPKQAAMLLALSDRVGIAAEQNINVKHEHTDLTGKAMLDEIRRLAEKHGLDPAKLLGGNVIEGEFKVVEPSGE